MSNSDTIVQQLKDQIQKFEKTSLVEHVGTVLEVGDGIARISGLSQVASMEMLDFGNDIFGVALNLEERSVGAIILGESISVKQGDTVKSTGKINCSS